MYETQARFICAVCGAENIVDVDLSGGLEQDYTEDCEVCCAPNKIHVHFEDESLKATVTAAFDE